MEFILFLAVVVLMIDMYTTKDITYKTTMERYEEDYQKVIRSLKNK